MRAYLATLTPRERPTQERGQRVPDIVDEGQPDHAADIARLSLHDPVLEGFRQMCRRDLVRSRQVRPCVRHFNTRS